MIIEEINLKTFKGFQDFRLACSDLTVLMGENNSGKTSILQALQVVSSILRFCFGDGEGPSFGQPRWDYDPIQQFQKLGYPAHLREELWFNRLMSQPFGLTVKLSGEVEVDLQVTGPERYKIDVLKAGTSIKANSLTDETSQKIVMDLYRRFCSEFVLPVGTITPGEEHLNYPKYQEIVRKGRSSEVWRGSLYWIHNDNKEAFEEYVSAVKRYLPDIDILAPRLAHDNAATVEIRFKDKKTSLDILSGGGGLRTIMSLLARLVFTKPGVLLFDEPDAHLHGTLQREVARMLIDYVSENDVQVFVSTHAPDFIAEVPLEKLVWIDRRKKEGQRCEGIGKTLVELGSMSHIDAIRSVGADKVLFVEGDLDKKVLEGLVRKAGLQTLFEDKTVLIARLPGGKGDKKHVAAFCGFLRNVLGYDFKMACITDNDYEIAANGNAGDDEICDQVAFGQLEVKEIENYLIEPQVLCTAAKTDARRQTDQGAKTVSTPSLKEIEKKLAEVCEKKAIRDAVKYQMMQQFMNMQNASLSNATGLQKAEEAFDVKWKDFDWRIRHCSGKQVLKVVREWMKSEYGLSLSNRVLLKAVNDCPPDVERIAKNICEHFYG